MFEELKPHLIELRRRLFVCVIVLVVMFALCFALRGYILEFLKAPLIAVLPEAGAKLNVIEVQEALFTAMKLSLFGGFILALPVIFWQFWGFVSPGLYANEKRLVLPFVLLASLMFVLGAGFCYFFVVPLAFGFLINFSLAEELSPVITLGSYVEFFIKVILAFGLAFELPVFAFFLARIGLIDEAFLRRHFRIAVLIIFIFSAIMTPPDLLSQFLMALPLTGLYVLSIYIVRRAARPEK